MIDERPVAIVPTDGRRAPSIVDGSGGNCSPDFFLHPSGRVKPRRTDANGLIIDPVLWAGLDRFEESLVAGFERFNRSNCQTLERGVWEVVLLESGSSARRRAAG